jgi:hypothetical protein
MSGAAIRRVGPVGFNVGKVVDDGSGRREQAKQNKSDRSGRDSLHTEYVPDEQRHEQQHILDPLVHADRTQPRERQLGRFLLIDHAVGLGYAALVSMNPGQLSSG